MGFDLSKLGVEENIPKVNFTEYSGLLQAEPKFGKTTFATLYDNCILLACEVGYKAKKINFRRIPDWDTFIEFINSMEEFREEIGDDIKTIAIDTVDRLYPMCQDYIVRKYNRKKPSDSPRAESIGDIPHGKGWSESDTEFLRQLTRILDLGFTYLFITHNVVKTITPKNGVPYDVYKPTMPDRCANIVYPLVDFIINGERVVVTVDGEKVNKRAINLRGNDMASGGSRVGNIEEKIIFDTEQEAMDKFRESFKKAILEEVQKGGSKIDVDKLAKEQEKEKKETVKGNLQKANLSTLLKEINEVIKRRNKEEKSLSGSQVMEILALVDVKNPKDIDNIEDAEKVLNALKEA
jgi:hypothetical protein